MGTWITGAIVLAIICLASRKLYKDRKSGKSCSCGCDSCAECPSYNEHEENPTT